MPDVRGGTAPVERICIIGAGAGGLSLASAMSARGLRVVLLEGGDMDPPDELEDTYRVDSIGVPHRGAHSGRFRAWGGSTTRWGGQLWPWEPHEFGGRPDLGIDGWPIPAGEVTRYYSDAFAMLGTPAGTLSPDAATARGVAMPRLDPAMFTLKYSAWLPWGLRNLGRTIGKTLLSRPTVERHLRTTAVSIVMDAANSRAVGVRVRTPAGELREIPADTVVIAAGAIETTRLLYATATPDGPLGGRSGWLGRAFMDHLSVRIGRFHPRDPRSFSAMFAPVFVRRVQHTPRILLQPEVLRREKLLGAYGHWDVVVPPDSGLLFIRDRLRAVQSGRGFAVSAADVRRGLRAVGDGVGLARGLLLEGRRHFHPDAEINLRVDTEQRPDPESRIIPTGAADSLGLPRISIDWRVSELERRTVRRTAELLSAEFERAGIGTMSSSPDPFSADVPWGELKGDSFHMMGGTRMAATEDLGVVDTDARVFGTRNVYVAGASIFPTGGMANPTLTLIALALRLANHLAPARSNTG